MPSAGKFAAVSEVADAIDDVPTLGDSLAPLWALLGRVEKAEAAQRALEERVRLAEGAVRGLQGLLIQREVSTVPPLSFCGCPETKGYAYRFHSIHPDGYLLECPTCGATISDDDDAGDFDL